MLNQAQAAVERGSSTDVDTYDLVVIGAGIAGLNALYAAISYLPQGARVLLLDQKQAAGGMWNTAYDYVRLHQPHPMFTVGDLKWNWDKPPSYLAARDEVREHLASALTPVGEKADLLTLFGCTASSCREVATDQGYRAEVTFHPNGKSDESRTVLARRAIYASGLDYQEAQPLKLSSNRVISIIPQVLRETLAAHPGAPVYVVGGGKTGMDTILTALAQDPERKITLINGRGTNFLNRTKYIPTGLKRWTSGELVSRLFRDLAMNFDGDNEEHTIAHFRANHSTDPGARSGVYLYGLQSEDEQARIANGLAETHQDYLVDVEDAVDSPCMKLRSGATLQVPEGSIFVNCTGSFFRTEGMAEPRPVLSPHDTVLSIGARDSMHFLTSVGGFFLTHLLYRESLRGRGFYMLDHEALFRKNRNAWIGASATQAYMNQVIGVQTLPMSLLDRCGLDLDRWYPLPRRMAGLIRMKANARVDIAQCRKTLDRVAERFDIHCALLQ
jgi:glycine/D-amino acid oxidase-like deaminating enzyme